MYLSTHLTDYRRKSIAKSSVKVKSRGNPFRSSSSSNSSKNISRPRSTYQSEFSKKWGLKGLSKPVVPTKGAGIPLGTRQKEFQRRAKTVDRSTYRRVPARPQTAIGLRRTDPFPSVFSTVDAAPQNKGKRELMTMERGTYRYMGKMNQQRYRRKVSQQSSFGFSTKAVVLQQRVTKTDRSHYLTTNRAAFSAAKGARTRTRPHSAHPLCRAKRPETHEWNARTTNSEFFTVGRRKQGYKFAHNKESKNSFSKPLFSSRSRAPF